MLLCVLCVPSVSFAKKIQDDLSPLSVTLSVHVAAADQVSFLSRSHTLGMLSGFGLFPGFAASAASLQSVTQKPWWLTGLDSLNNPAITITLAVLLLVSLMYTLAVSTHVKHVWRLFVHPYHHAFHHIAHRDENGTYLHSYALFHHHAQFAKHATLASTALFLLKVTFVAGFSSFFFRIPSATHASDGAMVVPGATLRYHVDFQNTGGEVLSGLRFIENFPNGTSYVPGSAVFDGKIVTDVSDGDIATLSGNALVFDVGMLGPDETSSLEWDVVIDYPSTVRSISNSVTYQSGGLPVSESNQVSNEVYPLNISGKVFRDVNENAVLDVSTEAGFLDVGVNLYEDSHANGKLDGVDTLLASASTIQEGYYIFSGLPPGTYFVEVQEATLPKGSSYAVTSSHPQKVVLQGQNSSSSQDFGYIEPEIQIVFGGSITGSVWHDEDRDEHKGESEIFLDGVGVSLYIDSNGNQLLDTLSDELVQHSATDAEGQFVFDSLSIGNYFITVNEDDISDEYTLSTANVPSFQKITEDNGSISGIGFGYAKPVSSIGDEVFEDTNNNTLHDDGEMGFGGVRLLLYSDTDASATFDANVDLLATQTTTDSFGKYFFSHVRSGSYFVVFDESTLPSDSYILTTKENPRYIEVRSDTNARELLVDFGYKSISIALANIPQSESVPSEPTVSAGIPSSSPDSFSDATVEPSADTQQDNQSIFSDIDVPASETESSATLPVLPPAPPTLLLMNSQPVLDVKKLFLDKGILVLEGIAEPSAEVFLQLFSDDQFEYSTVSNDEGFWSITIDPLLLSTGQYHVYAKTVNDIGASNTKELSIFDVQFLRSDDRQSTILVAVLFVVGVVTLIVVFRGRKKNISYNTLPKEKK